MKYFSLNFSFVGPAAVPTRWEYRPAVLEMSFGMSEFRAIVWRSSTTVRRSQPSHWSEDRPKNGRPYRGRRSAEKRQAEQQQQRKWAQRGKRGELLSEKEMAKRDQRAESTTKRNSITSKHS